MHERYMFLSLAWLARSCSPGRSARLRRLVGAPRPQPLVPVAYWNSQWGGGGHPVRAVVRLARRRLSTSTAAEKALVARGAAIARSSLSRASSGCAGAAGPRAALAVAGSPAEAIARCLRRPPAVRSASDAGGRGLGAVALARGSVARWGPRAVVGLACVFCLVILRGETTAGEQPQRQRVPPADGALGRRADREGTIPLDGWYPDLSLGSSFFHHYQSLPHTLTALIARTHRRERPDAPTSGSCTSCSRSGRSAVYLAARLLGWGAGRPRPPQPCRRSS